MAKPSLTAARLRELLSYDPITGLFCRICDVRHGARPGPVKGQPTNEGYLRISLDGRRHKLHRLAWLYMTGEWPADQIDHINHVRDDNRWANLREATSAQNQQNRRARKRPKAHLPPGVGQDRPNQRFHAQVCLAGKVHYLGTFDTLEEAHEAYLAKKRELHAFCTL